MAQNNVTNYGSVLYAYGQSAIGRWLNRQCLIGSVDLMWQRTLFWEQRGKVIMFARLASMRLTSEMAAEPRWITLRIR